MNLAQIVGPTGLVDQAAVERILAEVPALSIPTLARPSVTVREWSARTQRHEVLYEGPMRVQHIISFAANKPDLS